MIKLKGHETFAIREGWLSKGLIEVDKNEKVFSKNLEQTLWEWEVIWQRLSDIG